LEEGGEGFGMTASQVGACVGFEGQRGVIPVVEALHAAEQAHGTDKHGSAGEQDGKDREEAGIQRIQKRGHEETGAQKQGDEEGEAPVQPSAAGLARLIGSISGGVIPSHRRLLLWSRWGGEMATQECSPTVEGSLTMPRSAFVAAQIIRQGEVVKQHRDHRGRGTSAG
jgi:hypothetical protein